MDGFSALGALAAWREQFFSLDSWQDLAELREHYKFRSEAVFVDQLHHNVSLHAHL
jgi:hypothetical protein